MPWCDAARPPQCPLALSSRGSGGVFLGPVGSSGKCGKSRLDAVTREPGPFPPLMIHPSRRVRSQMEPTPGSAAGFQAFGGNFGWLLGEKLVRWVIGVSVAAVVARHLGPGDFGRLNLALAVVALFSSFAGAGIENILTRELVRQPGRAAELLATVAFVRLAAGLVALVAGWALVMGVRTFDGELLPLGLIAILSSGLVFQAGEVLETWFQAQLRARVVVVVRTSVFAGFAGVRLALVAAGAPVAAFAWAFVAEAALIVVGLAGVYRATGRSPGEWRFVEATARSLLRESWPNLLSALAIAVYMRADRLILGYLADERTVGFFSAASAVAEIWYILPTALIATLNPALTRLQGEDRARYWEKLRQVAQFLALLGWVLLISCTLSARTVISALYGPEFQTAAALLPVMMLSTLFAFIGVAVSPWYLNEGAMRPALRRHAVGALVGLSLNLLLVPRWGAVGAAWSTAAAFASAHWLGNLWQPKTRPLFWLQTRALLFGSLSSLRPTALLRR